MVRFSQILALIISVLTLLWSFSTFSYYAHIVKNGLIECNSNAPTKTLLFGIFLFCLSLVGLIAAIRGSRRLLLIYAGVMFVWFVCALLSSAFFMVLSMVSDPKAVKDHREYQLNEYPEWLRRHTVEGEKWAPIKRCMVRDQTCKGLRFEKDMSEASNEQVGKPYLLYSCCQPPLRCGFVHTNGTYWEVPKSGNALEDSDCQAWRNNLDEVCYDCNSCKAGYIRTRKHKWVGNAFMLALSSGFVFIGFWIAFWAFRQAPREDPYRYTTNNVSVA